MLQDKTAFSVCQSLIFLPSSNERSPFDYYRRGFKHVTPWLAGKNSKGHKVMRTALTLLVSTNKCHFQLPMLSRFTIETFSALRSEGGDAASLLSRIILIRNLSLLFEIDAQDARTSSKRRGSFRLAPGEVQANCSTRSSPRYRRPARAPWRAFWLRLHPPSNA